MRAQCVLAALCCQLLAFSVVHAAEQATPLAIGETFTLQSKVLNEIRRINVYLPSGYAEAPDKRFPALYMPDGGLAEDFLHVAGLVQVSVGNGTNGASGPLWRFERFPQEKHATVYHPAALMAFRAVFSP
jgi:hypothetical protein